ncbi:MAG: hypothetical protein IJ339_07295, partial [Oscillospiraceae bacterium]|nr:hypothetical protein [Oscillospiraceae bacterium]
MNERKFFTGNQLKLIAAIAMVIDHIGSYLLPQMTALRIIGRLAYPIFAFMIAEGFTHTQNRKKYLLRMVIMSVILQLVYAVVVGSAHQCIFVTFSLSIALCMLADNAIKRDSTLRWAFFALAVVGVCFYTTTLPDILTGTGFSVDYGFFGVMLPVVVFMAKTRRSKLIMLTVMLCLLSAVYGYIQCFALAAVPL